MILVGVNECEYLGSMPGSINSDNVSEIKASCVGASDAATDGAILCECDGLYVGDNVCGSLGAIRALFVGALACEVDVLVGARVGWWDMIWTSLV